MQVSNPNNIKIYNLSAGKSLPEWLTDRKKRSLQRDDIDIRRRIELIQDFDMPTVSNCVHVTKNAQYILATGVYKPRVKCYDVNQMSMKFERCMDSEVIKLLTLEQGYSKMVFLQADRYLEFHSQEGRYYRTRIPKYGRDMSYYEPSCDLYIVGTSSDIYRFNLEQGRFMSSLKTDSTELNCCEFNPVHQLFSCGTKQGTVECWDPRDRSRAGILDCAIAALSEETGIQGIPSVTSLKYKDGLQMAVGTKSGQVILYDLRSNKPLLIKDHMYGQPIKSIEFHENPDLVISCDTRIVKLWHRDTGKPFTSIEPGTNLNNMCILPNSGLMFLAHESPKMLTYYIPNLGAAPRWCSFLDSLTEELEENPTPTVYDDYKFVTRTELDSIGLTHLIGSSLLRAYMHGFFIDIKLYNKAHSIAQPFAYDDYKKTKIKEKIEEKRQNRIQAKKLPKVNKLLAEKLRDEEQGIVSTNKKKKKVAESLLKDDRFSKLFADSEFQIDHESEEYKLINPLLSKIEKDRRKKSIRNADDDDGDSSSDDEHTWTDEVKKQHKMIRQKEKAEKMHQKLEDLAKMNSKPKYFELKQGVSISEQARHKRITKKSLGDRLEEGQNSGEIQQRQSIMGNMQMTFSQKKIDQNKEKDKQHLLERKKVRRSAKQLEKKSYRPK